MTGRVEGKVAFITGAARGQGRSHAIRLAEEGADIIAVDLCAPIPNVPYQGATEEDLAQTAAAVEALDRRIVTAKVDVRDRDGLAAILERGVTELGHLDVVCANAGIMIMGEWDKQTPDIWDQTIATNLTGVWNTAWLAAPYLIKNGGGSMILTSSAAGIKGQPFLAPYVAAKHGVVGVMRALATELAEYNVRVNTVHPTGVATPMAGPELATIMPPIYQAHPRLSMMSTNLLDVQVIEPRDVSNAVLFLASDESRYVTSLEFTVDAGTTQY